MIKKFVSGVFLAILFCNVLGLALDILPVEASGIIYIRADGSIEPVTANITSYDNVTYLFTDDNYDEIVIERSNIIINGCGYTLQGSGYSSNGIYLHGLTNVTIKNTNVKGFNNGISLESTSHNLLLQNNVTNNDSYGFWLYNSSNNTINGNNAITNDQYGIYLYYSSNNTINGNSFFGCGLGVRNSYDNVVVDNLVNGKPLVYLEGVSDYIIENAGQVILINSNRTRVESLNLSNATTGVTIIESNNNTINGNNVTNNDNYGFYLYNSSNNTISRNNLTENNLYGIVLYSSSNNTISRNNMTASNEAGVSIHWYSNNNTVYGNNIVNTYCGVYIHASSASNTLSGNNITNNELGIHIYHSSYNTLWGNNIVDNNDGVQLEAESSYNTLIGNTIASNRARGVHFWSVNNNTLCENNMVDNQQGIYLIWSQNNSVSGNKIMNNEWGIALNDASSNRFYHNSFINNTQLIHDASYIYPSVPPSVNVWDKGYPSGGNYWGDNNRTDLHSGHYQNLTGSDGIGDTPYVIDSNNTDHYPLMKPHGGYHDIGITSITPYKTIVAQGYTLNITMKLLNYGVAIENFSATVYVGTIVIHEQATITLESRNSTTLTFTWNTTDFAKGNYTISAVVDTVPGETDTIDNTFIGDYVLIAMVGDITGPENPSGSGRKPPDGECDMRDVGLVARYFGQAVPPAPPECDVTGPATGVPDGIVDMRDVGLVARHFGETDP